MLKMREKSRNTGRVKNQANCLGINADFKLKNADYKQYEHAYKNCDKTDNNFGENQRNLSCFQSR